MVWAKNLYTRHVLPSELAMKKKIVENESDTVNIKIGQNGHVLY